MYEWRLPLQVSKQQEWIKSKVEQWGKRIVTTMVTFIPVHIFHKLSPWPNGTMTSMIANCLPSSMPSTTGNITSREPNTLSLFSPTIRTWLTFANPKNCLIDRHIGWCSYRTSISPSFTLWVWPWDPPMLQFTVPFSSLASTQPHLILSSPRNHLTTPPSRHLITSPPCCLDTLTPCHLTALPPCHLITSSPRHLITTTSWHSPPRHPIVLSTYHSIVLILSSPHLHPRLILILILASSSSSPHPRPVLISSPISEYPWVFPFLDIVFLPLWSPFSWSLLDPRVSFVLFFSSPSLL